LKPGNPTSAKRPALGRNQTLLDGRAMRRARAKWYEKATLGRPVFDPQIWDARKVAFIVSHQRRPLHQRVGRNPQIMIRDHFTPPGEIGFDSTEAFGNRGSERQEFHGRKESAIATQILFYL
jgi:hypothetical protein